MILFIYLLLCIDRFICIWTSHWLLCIRTARWLRPGQRHVESQDLEDGRMDDGWFAILVNFRWKNAGNLKCKAFPPAPFLCRISPTGTVLTGWWMLFGRLHGSIPWGRLHVVPSTKTSIHSSFKLEGSWNFLQYLFTLTCLRAWWNAWNSYGSKPAGPLWLGAHWATPVWGCN